MNPEALTVSSSAPRLGLMRELDGYLEYKQVTRYRLFAGVW